MGNWSLYKDGDNINVDNELARQIIEKLAKEVSKSFYSPDTPIIKRGERTTKLFEALTLMGDEKNIRFIPILCLKNSWINIKMKKETLSL